MNKWFLEQIKPGTSLEAKLAKLKLSYFRHIMRSQRSLEKTVMLGKTEGSRKSGSPNMRWIDFIKVALGLSLHELSRAVEDGTLCASLIHRVTRSRSRLNGTEHNHNFSKKKRKSCQVNANEFFIRFTVFKCSPFLFPLA